MTGQPAPAERVHAAVNSVQAACASAVLHGVPPKAQIHQLAVADHAVLPVGYLGDQAVKWKLSAYIAVKFHRVPAWQVNPDGT